MDIEFVELTVEDYGPFAGKHTLTLNGKGVTFVKGSNLAEPALGANDAGKSTLLNALPWCLYGRTTNDLVATDVTPWVGKGQTRATVKLIAWDGDEGVKHTIVRTANPNSITLNGKPCLANQIEKLVGWSLPVFRQAVFLGQGQPLFHDLPNREKLEFLVDVLGLSRWDTYADRAATRTAELDQQLARTIGELSANKVRVEELAAQVARQQEETDNWEGWRTERMNDAEKQTKKLGKRVEELRTLHADLASRLDLIEVDLGLVQKDEALAYKVENEAHIALHIAVGDRQTAQEKHDGAVAELATLKKSKLCPTCGNKITKEATLVANRERLQKAIAQFAADANEATVKAARGKLEKARAKATGWATQAKELLGKVEALAPEERLARRNLGEAELELKGARRQYDELKTGDNPHRGRLSELRKAHKRAVQDGESLTKDCAQLSEGVQRTKYWVKGFKDVRLYVLEDVLDELEFTTNAMLDTMGLLGWEVRYGVERETKSGTTQRGLITTVIGPHKKTDVKWKSWGGGVGQRLRLAGALALSQVLLARAGVECNLEVLDEPTAHLSSEGVEDLCEVLADRAKALGKAVYLVDHKAIESARFARVVTVVKDKQGSRIT